MTLWAVPAVTGLGKAETTRVVVVPGLTVKLVEVPVTPPRIVAFSVVLSRRTASGWALRHRW